MATLIKFRIGGSDQWLRDKIRMVERVEPETVSVIVEDEMWRSTHAALAALLYRRNIPYGGCEVIDLNYAASDPRRI